VLGTAWLLAAALTLQSAAAAPAPAPPEPAAIVQDRPFQNLFQNLGTDLRRIPSSDSAVILSSGVFGALWVRTEDTRLSNWSVQQGHSSYTSIGGVVGDGWVQAGTAVGTYAIGLATHSPLTTHVGTDLIRGQALNGLLTRGVKLAAQRNRPSGGPNSLPSGHTSAAFTTAAVLQGHFGWKVGAPMYALAGFVGWTRVRDDQHWLTDTIVGGAIGSVVGHAVTMGHREQRWVIVPAKNGRDYAIYLVKAK
jgi:hypothetical protein